MKDESLITEIQRLFIIYYYYIFFIYVYFCLYYILWYIFYLIRGCGNYTTIKCASTRRYHPYTHTHFTPGASQLIYFFDNVFM